MKHEVFNGELKKMKKKSLNLEIEGKSKENSSFYVRFEQKKEKKIKILWREAAMKKKFRNRRARLAWTAVVTSARKRSGGGLW